MTKTKNNSTNYLSDYDKSKGNQWDCHKDSTDKASFFYQTSNKPHHKKYSLRMDQCAEWLKFQFQQEAQGQELKLKLLKANFCRVRFCPVCQWRRSMVWRARFFQNLPRLLEEYPNYQFLFLTLTIKNCEIKELASALKTMNEAWNKLRLRKEFKVIQGFVRATEITKNKDFAHPHFHCILAVKKSYFTSKDYIKQSKWAELWQSVLNVDYLPIIDIRKIRMKKGQLDSRAIIETLKYTTKIQDLLEDKNWFLELSDQLAKKRFIATGGCFKNLLREDLTNKEMIEAEDCEDENLEGEFLWFNWNSNFRKYVKVKK